MSEELQDVPDLLSEELEDYIAVLDRQNDRESVDEELREKVEKMIRAAVSSLEGFAEPYVRRLLALLQSDRQNWQWFVDDFYSREAVARIQGMVSRFLRLAPVLTGVIPTKEVTVYLREATRCFIYGFFQASIVLCRAALEAGLNHHLERKLGTIPNMDLADKIQSALRFKLVTAPAATLAHGVRKSARDVLHRKPAKQTLAFATLVRTRGFLMELYEK